MVAKLISSLVVRGVICKSDVNDGLILLLQRLDDLLLDFPKAPHIIALLFAHLQIDHIVEVNHLANQAHLKSKRSCASTNTQVFFFLNLNNNLFSVFLFLSFFSFS